MIIAWKGAAPTGSRKRAGSTTEEQPSKKSKQGMFSLSLFLKLIPLSAVTQPMPTTQPQSKNKGK